MENIILHSTPLKDLQAIIGDIVEQKLQQFRASASQPATQKDGYMTRREVCDLLKISLATLHYYTKEGTVQGYRIGGRVLYKSAEVQAAVQEIQSTKYKHGRK